MMNEECPNCGQLTNTSFSRLVKDTCGHTKCRMCLLYEEQGCKTCNEEHRIQNIGNFDCPSSSKQVSNNIFLDTKTSVFNEEIILPLELVINKDSKSKENSFEFLSEECASDLKSHYGSNIHSNSNRKEVLYGNETSDIGNNNASSKLYNPKIETSNVISNIHSNETNNVPDIATTSAITTVETDSTVSKATLELKSKSQSLKNKHLKYPDRSHISVIPGIPERYKCNVCKKTFRNKKGKCYHDACITGVKPYQCSYCDRGFVKRSHFEYHERIHSGYKPYKCNLCEKAFPQQNKLNRHMYSHSKEKQFACSKCSKTYSKQDDLKSHLAAHNATTTYTCKVCEKSFRILTNLKRHMRTHTNERPHICNECNKSFKDKSLLIRHKRTHGKERPFSCAHCNRVFLSKSELRRHLTVHSDEKPFSCEYCQTVFRRKDNLNRHIRHHHSDGTAFMVHKSQNTVSNTNKTLIKVKQINNSKQKQKSKKTQRTPSNTSSKSTAKVSVVYVNSLDQINSRLDSMGNITPVIRTTGELSNAVPVINGPISIKKLEEKADTRKKMFTYTEPIPLAEAVVINRRIEEKLYPQNGSTHNYFFRNHTNRSDKSTFAPQATRTNVCTKNCLIRPAGAESSLSELNTSLHSEVTYQNAVQNLSSSESQLCKKNINYEVANTDSCRISESKCVKEVIVEVINVNQQDQEHTKDNASTSMNKEQVNCVSTIKARTLPQFGVNDNTEAMFVNEQSSPVSNTSLLKNGKNLHDKELSNVHWRRRTAETLKPCT